jgi:hypothetical protein
MFQLLGNLGLSGISTSAVCIAISPFLLVPVCGRRLIPTRLPFVVLSSRSNQIVTPDFVNDRKTPLLLIFHPCLSPLSTANNGMSNPGTYLTSSNSRSWVLPSICSAVRQIFPTFVALIGFPSLMIIGSSIS